MTILATAKSKLNGNVKEAFKNEDGAIDLASIMVGIIVIGIIGGVIAATVFAVIPWAQDNGAKQQLDSVASAESAYIGLSADAGQQSFASLTGDKITSGTNVLFDATGLNKTATTLSVVASGVGNDAHYGAAVKSQSGKVFYISDTKTKATNTADAAPTASSNEATAVSNLG